MSVIIYGIKNCDTVKKALTWLNTHAVPYQFHDYKKQGVDEAVLKQALDMLGWESVINRRGTSWRKLTDDVKDNMNDENAFTQALENPSLIKRPLVSYDGKLHLGFKSEEYEKIFL